MNFPLFYAEEDYVPPSKEGIYSLRCPKEALAFQGTIGNVIRILRNPEVNAKIAADEYIGSLFPERIKKTPTRSLQSLQTFFSFLIPLACTNHQPRVR
jgi:hypothetical protein